MVRFSVVASLMFGVAFFACGCNSQKDYKTSEAVKQAPALPEHEHEHSAKGPHGGGIVELGEEEYHAEVVVDHDSESLSVYLLGQDAKTAEPVAASELSIALEGKDALVLKATPQESDGEGKSSKFALVDHDLVHTLMDTGFLHGDLRITIGDKPYLGHIDYHLDGSSHEGHDHDEKK
jgi:hypothetical protein